MSPTTFPPLRIVSLLPAATEIVFGLDLGEALVAVSHECDFPPAALGLPRATRSRVDAQQDSGGIDRQVADLLTRGEPLYELDARLLRALRPNVLITQSQCDVCAIRLADVQQLVRSSPELSGAQIVTLQPQSLAEMLDDISRIAAAAGAETAGAAYRHGLQQRLDRVRETTAALLPAQRPRVFLLEWTEPPMAGGNWTPELLAWAGGAPGLAEPGAASRYVTWDEIAAFDPECLLAAPCGFGLSRTLAELAPVRESAAWRGLTAVRSGRAWALDGNAYFNRGGPRLVDSLELAAWLLHPELLVPPPEIAARPQVFGRLA